MSEHWVLSVGAVSRPLDEALGRHLRKTSASVCCTVVHSTEEAVQAARQAIADGASRVIAVGGDGTLHGVVNGAIGGDVVVGLVPQGTANDFARAAGLHELPLDDAIRLAAQGSPTPVDLMDAGDCQVANVVTLGFAARLSEEVPRPLKDTLGGLAYPFHALSEVGAWRATPITVETPTRTWSGDALGVCICNGIGAGGGLPLAPQALLNDGLLDVVIIPADGALSSAARLVEALVSGATEAQGIVHLPTRCVTLRSAEPIAVSVDGELTVRRELTVHVASGALSIPVGPTARLRATDQG